LRCPILFVHGQKSRPLSHSDIAEIRAAVPNAKIAVIPNAHHHVMLDQPEALATVIGEFVKSRPPAAANGGVFVAR
jgi:pimeloyl-ACP methyl ester carboxylesterase